MFTIESFEHLEQAIERLVGAHTNLDRVQIANGIRLFLEGHPREAAIRLLLDGLCAGSHNLDGRLAAADEIRRLTDIDKAALGPIEIPGGEESPALAVETVHYADGSSATGVAPLPETSPEGAPAIAGHPETPMGTESTTIFPNATTGLFPSDPPQTVPVTGETLADPETAAILDRGVDPASMPLVVDPIVDPFDRAANR